MILDHWCYITEVNKRTQAEFFKDLKQGNIFRVSIDFGLITSGNKYYVKIFDYKNRLVRVLTMVQFANIIKCFNID